jgi:hypothetical protein
MEARNSVPGKRINKSHFHLIFLMIPIIAQNFACQPHQNFFSTFDPEAETRLAGAHI